MSDSIVRLNLMFVSIGLGLFGLALALFFREWPAIPYADDLLTQVGKAAGALCVVAAFLERGLAVINDSSLESRPLTWRQSWSARRTRRCLRLTRRSLTPIGTWNS